jgi:hypothetical protein
MKKILSIVFSTKDSKTTLILALAMLSLVVLACSGGGGKTGKTLPASYYGGWTSKDGASLQLTSEGLGYYRSGGTTINGAGAELDETGKILKLSFVGVSVKEFKVDQEPKDGVMKLDGVSYFNGAANRTDDSNSNDSGDSTDGPLSADPSAIPPQAELNDLTKDVVLKFNDAVQEEDFSDFRDEYCAEEFKNNFSADKLAKEFKTFIAQKAGLDGILKSVEDMKPTYAPAPSIGKDGRFDTILKLSGSYATTPETKFKMEYVPDDGKWKLINIWIRVEKTK